MDLGKLINSIFGRESRYESVDAKYLKDGAFTLSTERNNRKIIYNSQETYTLVTESPLLGLFSKKLATPLESKIMAPAMTIEYPEKNEIMHIIYDKENNVMMVGIKKDGQILLQIDKYGHQKICTDPSIDNETISKIVSYCTTAFKKQQRLFGVKTHQKKALEKTVQ